jgi:hypothetical protein
MERHEKTCKGDKINEIYPGGVYKTQDTIWDSLAAHGLDVDVNYVYPFTATYDIESYFDKTDVPTTKTIRQNTWLDT